MRWTIIICTLYTITAFGDSYSDAINAAMKAASKTQPVKKVLNTVEKRIKNLSPFDDDINAIIGTTAITAISGKIDTKALNMDIGVGDGKIRPDVEYKFSGETGVKINYNLEF